MVSATLVEEASVRQLKLVLLLHSTYRVQMVQQRHCWPESSWILQENKREVEEQMVLVVVGRVVVYSNNPEAARFLKLVQ